MRNPFSQESKNLRQARKLAITGDVARFAAYIFETPVNVPALTHRLVSEAFIEACFRSQLPFDASEHGRSDPRIDALKVLAHTDEGQQTITTFEDYFPAAKNLHLSIGTK